MKVFFHTHEVETPDFKTAEELLTHLGLMSSTAIVMKNGQVVEPKERLKPEDRMEVIKVMSGG